MAVGGALSDGRVSREELREVRCRVCGRLLCKATELRGEGTIEIKCASCDAMNYLKGRPA